MKLNETITMTTFLTNGGIFKKIQGTSGQPFTWLDSTLALVLDKKYYLAHSGEKTINPYFTTLLKLEDDEVIADSLQELANNIIATFKNKWGRLYTALVDKTYNPIENYNMEQVRTPNLQRDIESKQKTDISVTTDAENNASTYGFNSASAVPSGKNEGDSTVTTEGSLEDNKTVTQDKETGTDTLTRHGNIGVTTNQQMLEAEVSLRNSYIFYDIVMADVDGILTLAIY